MDNESRVKIPLTQNQAHLLEFIKTYSQENGFPPSYREIQRHFGYKAVGTVQDHVRALIQKGALQKSYGQNSKKARALIPSGPKPSSGKSIPIFGEIAAGGPREAIQTELGNLVIGDDLASGDCFALRVVGNSMIDIGIFEGDFVIVDRTQKVKNGDIIVALLEGETTVKRYRETKDKILLIPENRTLKPIEVTTEDFQIQGKVTGLQRKF
jgi:repressor LexA